MRCRRRSLAGRTGGRCASALAATGGGTGGGAGSGPGVAIRAGPALSVAASGAAILGSAILGLAILGVAIAGSTARGLPTFGSAALAGMPGDAAAGLVCGAPAVAAAVGGTAGWGPARPVASPWGDDAPICRASVPACSVRAAAVGTTGSVATGRNCTGVGGIGSGRGTAVVCCTAAGVGRDGGGAALSADGDGLSALEPVKGSTLSLSWTSCRDT